MEEIDNYSKKIRRPSDIIGPVESDPEYQLIVEANNLAVEIDNEIGNITYFKKNFCFAGVKESGNRKQEKIRRENERKR